MKKTATDKNNQANLVEEPEEDASAEIEDISSDEVIPKGLHVSDDFDVYVDPEDDEDILTVSPYASSDDDEDYY